MLRCLALWGIGRDESPSQAVKDIHTDSCGEDDEAGPVVLDKFSHLVFLFVLFFLTLFPSV